MLGYSVFRFVALLGRIFHQIRANAVVAVVRIVVAQTAVGIDIPHVVRVAGVRGTDHTLISLTFRLGGRLRDRRFGLFGFFGGRLLCLIPGGGHELNVQGALRPVIECPCVDVAALL